MTFITALWLPILASAVLVFVASSIIHMVLKTHNKDFAPLAGEAEFLAVLRAHNIAPGRYMFPHCGVMQAGDREAMEAKFKQGPVGFVTVTGGWAMGKSLALWGLYLILVSLFTAYAAFQTLPPGSDYLTVFRLTGAIAFLPYVLGNMPDSIWDGQPWRTTTRFFIDGAVYALVTAGTFAWLWPAAG